MLQQIAERRSTGSEEIDRTRCLSPHCIHQRAHELFSLKHFHVAIIDEASQILEPQIIGLLPRFDRFVMIGDHHQLSTIVLQDRTHSEISEPLLLEAGISDCRDSLFERLMHRCIEKGWHHAHVQLTHQGRMHQEIAAFPAHSFYPEGLSIANEWQSQPWSLSTASDRPLQQLVAHQRTAFITTEEMASPSRIVSTKINEGEAEVIAQLANAVAQVYRENNKDFSADCMGIIAPYRNQIAMIRQKLQQRDARGQRGDDRNGGAFSREPTRYHTDVVLRECP